MALEGDSVGAAHHRPEDFVLTLTSIRIALLPGLDVGDRRGGDGSGAGREARTAGHDHATILRGDRGPVTPGSRHGRDDSDGAGMGGGCGVGGFGAVRPVFCRNHLAAPRTTMTPSTT